MQLLLCASTEIELRPTIEFIQKENIQGVDILITGIGMMATTYTLTRSILNKRPDFVLQAGIAGCLDENLPLTKTVLVENENIGDLGVEEKQTFKTLFNLSLLDKNSFPWKHGKLSNNIAQLKSTGLKIVDAVSVNEISTDMGRIEYYKNELNASIESMEGAAFHFVCLQQSVPFLQVRSISNKVGIRDKSKWNIPVALKNLSIELITILDDLVNSENDSR